MDDGKDDTGWFGRREMYVVFAMGIASDFLSTIDSVATKEP